MSDIFLSPGEALTVHAGQAGTLLSTGPTGFVKFGFNQHAWPWSKTMYEGAGAKVMRIGGASYPRFIQDGGYPGPKWFPGSQYWNEVVQTCVDGACGDGFDVILLLSKPHYGPGDEKWGDFCTAVAKANLKQVSRVVLQIDNEPNWTGPVTGAEYAAILKVSASAIRAVSPAFRISAPAINASFNDLAKKFIVDLMATPGIEKCFDLGDNHPYYHTPEDCFLTDVAPFIVRMDTPAQVAGRTDLEYIASELGWSDATGQLSAWGLDPTKENTGPSIGNTHVQPPQVCGEYYSRWIPLARSTPKLRMVTFYALMDERPPNSDPGKTNVQGRFGVWDEKRSFLKEGGKVCKHLLPHVHAALAAQRYGRGDSRYVRLQGPLWPELIAWSPNLPADTTVVVTSQSGAILTIAKAGSPEGAITLPIPPGITHLPLHLTKLSTILTADKPVDFPEFPP